ncbi:MAG: thymidine kinase [bacterium]|nr:thymidine kinase [bacterium]
MTKHNLINPGILEVICGPMFSGKTFELIHRVEKLKYLEGSKYLFFKPARDTRTKNVKTRFNGLEAECVAIKKPEEILKNIAGCDLIGIDEAQFFQKDLVEVVEKLLKQDINVIVAGLDLDYRGVPFRVVSDLLSMADNVEKLFAACFHPRCNRKASRTQRLINGKPSHYNDPIIVVEGSGDEIYEARCIKHHSVPGKY